MVDDSEFLEDFVEQIKSSRENALASKYDDALAFYDGCFLFWRSVCNVRAVFLVPHVRVFVLSCRPRHVSHACPGLVSEERTT